MLGILLILIGSAAGHAPAAAPGAADTAVAPGELKAVATLRCIGIHCPVKGDRNGNATGTVRFRPLGQTEWHKGMDLLRQTPQKVDLEKGTCGGIKVIFLGGLGKWPARMRQILVDRNAENYLAGSIFGLTPGTRYEVEARVRDPDGGDATRRV